MSTVTQVPIYGGAAGLAIPVGAWLSQQDWFKSAWVASEVRHGILAFGAGALLAAVTLLLVSSGVESLSLAVLTLAFFGGGFVFAWLDLMLSRRQNTLSQVIAMLTDFNLAIRRPEYCASQKSFCLPPDCGSGHSPASEDRHCHDERWQRFLRRFRVVGIQFCI